MRPHVAVRSPMSAVSLRATRATAHTDELARPWSRRSLLMFRFGGLADADASVAVWEPATQASRRSTRFARTAFELITPFRTGALIAALHCAAPARGGAFVDERCIVGGNVGEHGRETLIQSPLGLKVRRDRAHLPLGATKRGRGKA